MKLYCPNRHVALELEGEMAAVNLEAIALGRGPTCGTCGEPLTTIAPFQRTCHPEFGCSCVDVTQLDVKEGQVLYVNVPESWMVEQKERARSAFATALHAAGHKNVPVVVGSSATLTVIDATDVPA